MRYPRFIIVITMCVILSSPLAWAGDIYLWTDEEGVVHITDNPGRAPPTGTVERIRIKDRGEDLSEEGQGGDAEAVTEEQREIPDRNKGLSEESNRGWKRKLQQAREEYDRARELVERQRRLYSRKHTRSNRDRYRRALDELAEKRERLRELQRRE